MGTLIPLVGKTLIPLPPPLSRSAGEWGVGGEGFSPKLENPSSPRAHYANLLSGTQLVLPVQEEFGRVLYDSVRRNPFDFDYSGAGQNRLNKEL